MTLVMENKPSQEDHTLFIKHPDSVKVTILFVYVDNINMTSNNEKERSMLKKCLVKELEIKELERLKCFLGTKMAYSKARISFHNKSTSTAS